MTLAQLPVGKEGVIETVGGEGDLRCRFLDMGLIPGTKVKVLKMSPMGDQIQIHLLSAHLLLLPVYISGSNHCLNAVRMISQKLSDAFDMCIHNSCISFKVISPDSGQYDFPFQYYIPILHQICQQPEIFTGK